MGTLFALSVQVLGKIIGYLSPREAIALSYTCKALHSLTLDPALHTVVLDRTYGQIPKFRDYLLATESRPGYLKSLVLVKAVTGEVGYDSSESANALADILEKAANLQRFDCGYMGIVNRVLNTERVAHALVALKKLREVDLRDVGTEIIKAIVSMDSLSLQTLSITFYHCEDMFETFFRPLARYVHLHTLSIGASSDRFRLPMPAEQLQDLIAIHSVRTLTIDGITIPLSSVAYMFPNVKRINYQSLRSERDRIAGPGLGLANPLVPALPPSWTHTLNRANLDVADLDIWPLTSRVNWLDIGLLPTGRSREAFLLIGQTNPRVLSCAYRVDAVNLLWKDLWTVATDLRFLDVRIIELSGRPKRHMFMHLSGLDSLIVVFLCIRAFYQPDDLDLELSSIVRDLVCDNRQLRFVGISLVDGRSMGNAHPMLNAERLGSHWWAIERTDTTGLEQGMSVTYDNAWLVPISTEVGLKIRDYMYEADYESPDWQQRLSAIVATT